MASVSIYELAFENWLIDNNIEYVPVDQRKKHVFSLSKIKSFDFIIYPCPQSPVLVEVKGRKFKGTSLFGLKNLQCWVTLDDVRSLIGWEKVFTPECRAYFVFVYQFEKIDVDPDGREVYPFYGERYVFFAVRLDDYRQWMKVRSTRWQTVTLSSQKFRQLAAPVRGLLNSA